MRPHRRTHRNCLIDHPLNLLSRIPPSSGESVLYTGRAAPPYGRDTLLWLCVAAPGDLYWVYLSAAVAGPVETILRCDAFRPAGAAKGEAPRGG